MKTIFAAIAMALIATPILADGPNNYIYGDSLTGEIHSLDHGGTTYDPRNRDVRTIDLASQYELDNLSSHLDQEMAGLAAIGSIQMLPNHDGLQMSLGSGFVGDEVGFAVGIGHSVGSNGFGFVSFTDSGTAAASLNWRF